VGSGKRCTFERLIVFSDHSGLHIPPFQATFAVCGAAAALTRAVDFSVLFDLRTLMTFGVRASAKRAATAGIPSIRIIAGSPSYLISAQGGVETAQQLSRLEEVLDSFWITGRSEVGLNCGVHSAGQVVGSASGPGE
jgi:hypothetical protein